MPNSEKDPWIGTRIREYEVLELLGKGGMAAVYLARHTLLEQERAIKIVHGRLAGDADSLERFIREAKILTRLRHPNLVQLHEFGTLEQDTFFMVMELIRGESLQNRIQRTGRIPVNDAIRIIRQAASGLHSAHKRGVIHRDVSPDNLILLIDHEGNETTKVIDFGIARPTTDTLAHHQTTSRFFIGKPEYCSPEQCGLLEEGETLDARSDIYSLAITFYHMLAGQRPFHSKTLQGYFLKHAHEIPQPVSTHFPSEIFPPALDRVILKALSKKREQRQSSMEEFIQDLDQAMSGGIPQVKPLSQEPRTGELFAGRYLVEKKLGHGEMGTVYKAIDKILNIPVALKTLADSVVEDEKTLERFKREVILARKVAHPNVCRIYDIGESGDIHYVSMEFVEGRTLADLIHAEGRLTLTTGVPLLRQILNAVQETHRAGIIHRDLKPQNIMVETGLRARIMDFGISISSDVHRVTQAGALVGTPHYMAPELFEGKEIDYRADIYSIGVIMYFLFTGKLPFDAATPVAVIYAHLKSEPSRPSDLIPGFETELERVILKALQKEPEKRYQTARDILHDLEPLAEPTTTFYGTVSREQTVHKLMAENRYSQAIKLLRSLLKTEPDNTHWKKLINNATSEKVASELRRARNLMQKKNLIQAGLVLDRIGRLQPVSRRIVSQVRKLEARLSLQKEQAIQNYLAEAEQLRGQNDFLAALACLESAWHLRPNDERIIALQGRIQTAQDAEISRQHQSKLEQATEHFQQGDEIKGLEILEELLTDYPDFQPAAELKDQILSARISREDAWITEQLELALQPLVFADYDIAIKFLEQILSGTEQRSFRVEIHRIQKAVEQISAALNQGAYDAVPELVQQLLSEDPYGWLEPYQAIFSDVERAANEKLYRRHQLLLDTLLEARKLSEQGEHTAAIAALDELLKEYPGLQRAIELRQEIINIERQELLDEAHAAFQQGQWQSAIDLSQRLLEADPGNEDAENIRASAEERLEAENELQEKLATRLKDCYLLLQDERWEEALELANDCQKFIRPGVRLQPFEHQIRYLRSRIQREIASRDARRKQLLFDLSEAERLIQSQQYQQALIHLNAVMQEDVLNEKALRLRSTVYQALEEQNLAQRFASTFDRGKEAFDSKQWQNALDFWRSCSKLQENPNLQQWISAAEDRLQQERELRKHLNTSLQAVEDLIFCKNFVDAQSMIQSCRKLITSDFELSEFGNRIQAIDEKLRQSIAQENVTRSALHALTRESRELYIQRDFAEALAKINSVLIDHPDWEDALELKVEIEQAILSLEHLKEIWQAAIQSLSSGSFKYLPRLLTKLQEEARNTVFQKEIAFLCEHLLYLARDIQASDLAGAEQQLQELLLHPGLTEDHRQQFQNLLSTLPGRLQKQNQSNRLLREAFVLLKEKRWSDAARCFAEMEGIDLDGDEQNQDYLSKLAAVDQTAIFDPEIKIPDSELLNLENQLRQNQIEEMLRAAEGLQSEGHLHQALKLFESILVHDPENEIARAGILSIEEQTMERTRIRAPGEIEGG